MIDKDEFIEGCKSLGGEPKDLNPWNSSCELGGISIGMNTNGTLHIFDRRNKTINDVAFVKLGDLRASGRMDNGRSMYFSSDEGEVKISKMANGYKIETRVNRYREDAVSSRELQRYGTSRIRVPDHSVIKMPAPGFTRIEWQSESSEPILFSDGGNIVKGTDADFRISSHQPELEYTRIKAPVSFTVGAEEDYIRSHPHAEYDDPPVCVPVGNVCFSRDHLYSIAEEISGKPIFKTYGEGVDKEAKGRKILLNGYLSKHPDFPGVLRIVDKGVNYVIYPIGEINKPDFLKQQDIYKW